MTTILGCIGSVVVDMIRVEEVDGGKFFQESAGNDECQPRDVVCERAGAMETREGSRRGRGGGNVLDESSVDGLEY